MRSGMLLLSAWAPLFASADELLRETWSAYVRRFVEPDGRVVDPKAGGITTSEGQAYAMLRAVWVNDRSVFDRAHGWAVEHLNRGVRQDTLWAWKWKGRVLDRAFAADADQDAALALLMAARAWKDDAYLERARGMLADLWRKGTLQAGPRRFLLGGDSLCQGQSCRVNPSYYAPYAYRYFARDDPAHDWQPLVDTTYWLLQRNAELTVTRLPSDWLLLDTRSGSVSLGSEKDSRYSYDAFRTHWRVALDALLFDEERALAYLEGSLAWLAARHRKERKIPAVIRADGSPGAEYEALEMLAALVPALRLSAPDVAETVGAGVAASVKDGLWGDADSYYLQNWAWFAAALERRDLTPFERLDAGPARGAGPGRAGR